MPNEMIRIGLVSNCHGINGEMKVTPLTDDINRFKKLKKFYWEKSRGSYEELNCTAARTHQDYVLLSAKEITDRTQAEKIKGHYICVRPEDAIKLPEGRYFIFQLEGLTGRRGREDYRDIDRGLTARGERCLCRQNSRRRGDLPAGD